MNDFQSVHIKTLGVIAISSTYIEPKQGCYVLLHVGVEILEDNLLLTEVTFLYHIALVILHPILLKFRISPTKWYLK